MVVAQPVIGPGDTAAARLVDHLDIGTALQEFGEVAGEEPGCAVGAATGRERNQKLDRLSFEEGRVGLRQRTARRAGQSANGKAERKRPWYKRPWCKRPWYKRPFQ